MANRRAQGDGEELGGPNVNDSVGLEKMDEAIARTEAELSTIAWLKVAIANHRKG